MLVKLTDPAAKVPWPGVPGRLLPAEPFEIAPLDPFWAALLRDGTLAPAPAPAPAKAKP